MFGITFSAVVKIIGYSTIGYIYKIDYGCRKIYFSEKYSPLRFLGFPTKQGSKEGIH